MKSFVARNIVLVKRNKVYLLNIIIKVMKLGINKSNKPHLSWINFDGKFL